MNPPMTFYPLHRAQLHPELPITPEEAREMLNEIRRMKEAAR